MSRKNTKKRKKLSGRLVKTIIVSMVSVTLIALAGLGFFNWFADKKFYNDKTMQIAKTVSDSVNGDFLEQLKETMDSTDYYDRLEVAIAYEDREIIKKWLFDNDMYIQFETCINTLSTIQTDMEVKYLYIQTINDGKCMTLIDTSEPFLSLGYPQDLTGTEFAYLDRNMEVSPIITKSEFGLLSSGGVPIYNSKGDAIAIAFCDIDASDMIKSTLGFVYMNGGITLIAVFIVSMISTRRIKKRITGPIEQLTDAVDNFGTEETGFNKENITELSIDTNDEIEELYHATHYMQVSIIDYMDNLTAVTAEKERIGAELDVATRIQASMLPNVFPPFPYRNDFDIYATMNPAKEVGGDFYDFFLIDDDHLGIVMADVSGKGVPAALFMMMSKIILSNFAQMGLSPAEVLAKTNDSICASNEEDMFVTVWFGILTISTGHIVAGNAGHEYPMIRSANGSFKVFEDNHDFVIGGMEGMPYSQYEFDLEKGGTLFLYTDGCPEATNANNELFGTNRMLTALNRDSSASPKDLLSNMTDAVNTFVGDAPQFDDLTMLAITLT